MRSATGALQRCQACAAGQYSVYPMLNDTVCLQCPIGTDSRGSAGAYCACLVGSYKDHDDACVTCPPVSPFGLWASASA